MANAYLTEYDIRNAMPDGVRTTTTKYNTLMRQLCERVSRYIDRYCQCTFYPSLETRYFDGSGTNELWIDSLFQMDEISMSGDNGATYTALVATDYILTRAGDYNTKKAYNKILINESAGDYSVFSAGQRTIKITGIWSEHDDTAAAWEDSLDAVVNNPLTAIATALVVTNADGVDAGGAIPRFAVRQLLRIEDEYVEVVEIDYTTNTLTIVRARNGTTAVPHVLTTPIDIWQPPMPIRQAAIIQAVRQMERGFQGFGDARATPEIGQLFYLKAMDPEATALLAPYRKTAVG